MWQIEPTYLTDAFRDFYDENPLNISRILDVAQDLKVRFSSAAKNNAYLASVSTDLGLAS